MCLDAFLLGFILYGTLCASWTWLTIPYSMLGEIFNYILFKNLLIPYIFPFFFWDPYKLNVDVFDISPEVSEIIPSSFYSFYVILLLRSYFHHFTFQFTDSFFCFRYSATDSFQRIFNFNNCVVCLCMFFL